MNRSITGLLLTAAGQPAAGVELVVELIGSGFTGEAQYVPGTVRAKADALGLVSMTLWANEESEVPSHYRARFASESFTFTLEPGVGPTSWAAVRRRALAGAIPPTETLRHFIEQEVTEQVGSGGTFPRDENGLIRIDAGLLP